MNFLVRDPVDVAWAAGFLDGEGHFGARSNGPALEAVQVKTDAPLRRLQRLFGGSITKRGGDHPAFVWRLHGQADTRLALLMLIPHLVVKRREAEVLLRFTFTFPGQRGVRPLVEVIQMREQLREELLHERRAA
jgi:enoyl reductase-like protein